MALCEIVDARSKFIVEQAGFFTSSFLVKEGLLDLNKFTAMAGVFGLYECVQNFSGKLGKVAEAEKLAEEIVKRAYVLVKQHSAAYCGGTAGRLGFHAQSGIDTDKRTTAGVRIKPGEEPELIEQLRIAGRLHKYFDTGASEICVFDQTAKGNLPGVMKLISGALKNGIRTLAINSADSELVRITGYIVKKTDINRYQAGKQIREDIVKLGADSIENCNIKERVVRSC